MDRFVEYLLAMGYSPSSIRQHIRYLEVFQRWLSERSLSAVECGYPEIIHFIDYAMDCYASRANPKSTLNRMMVSIAAYYDFLISNDSNISNPAKTIRIKNPVQRMAHNLLDKEELDGLYHSIVGNDVRNVRNKVILGFLVFQGLSTGELHRLKLKDIKLRKGTLFVGESANSSWKQGPAARELELEALQIIDLIDYIENYRPRILCDGYRYLPGRKLKREALKPRSDQLIFSIAGSQDLRNSLHHLFRDLSKLNPRVKNTTQIRQSVIAIWLKTFDLRTVQYMAGHRFVSSTEYYKQVDIEKLKREISELHPLK
jgi:integrase/recombinase XerD